LTIEELKLEQVVAKGSLHDLELDVREAQAEWAGGKVQAKINAKFLPRPVYDIAAKLERVNLHNYRGRSDCERVGGAASGTLQMKTAGVAVTNFGKLTGRGEFSFEQGGVPRLGCEC